MNVSEILVALALEPERASELLVAAEGLERINERARALAFIHAAMGDLGSAIDALVNAEDEALAQDGDFWAIITAQRWADSLTRTGHARAPELVRMCSRWTSSPFSRAELLGALLAGGAEVSWVEGEPTAVAFAQALGVRSPRTQSEFLEQLAAYMHDTGLLSDIETALVLGETPPPVAPSSFRTRWGREAWEEEE